MLLSLALLAMLSGLACFALSMPPHWRQLRGSRPLRPNLARGLRATGSCALLASFVLCLATTHASMAVLLWVMLLALGATAVALLLACSRPGGVGT